MGIIDTIKGFFEGKEKGKLADEQLRSVKEAAQASNYNQASMRAFFALVEMGKLYGNIDRTKSTTAREYSKLLVETGAITDEDLYPIINNFEIATYSPEEVTFDDYLQLETSLDAAHQKLKKIGQASAKSTRSRGAKRKPVKKRRRATSGKGSEGPKSSAARRRKARQKKR